MLKYACRTDDIKKAYQICGDSYQCKYDYSVSLNEELAKNTLQFQDSFVNIKTRNKERGKVLLKERNMKLEWISN